MTLSFNQRLFVFLILAVCLSAIPISMFVHRGEGDRQEDEDGSSLHSLLDMKDRILVVKLTGMIADKGDSSLLSRIGTSDSAKKKLHKAVKNKHVKAVLIRINSPGGTVASSQELAEEVRLLRKAGKPVVVSMGDVAASGGYYVACAADKIVASPGTMTGSIGVIMNLINLQGIEQKLGIEPQVVKSGQFKDMGSPHRAMTPEEKTLIQIMILDSYDQFVHAVADGRRMEIDTVKKLADGRVYTGRQALKAGLIDELGSYQDALASTQKLARDRYGLKKDLAVDEGEGLGFLSILLESAAARIAPDSFLGGALPESMRGDFQKIPLWMMQ